MLKTALGLFQKYSDVYLSGLANTLEAAALGLVLALGVGLVAGTMRHMGRPWAARPCAAYIALVRNTPMMVQIYFIYFGLPAVGLTLSAYATGIIALTFNSGAYIAEIVRGGLEAVPEGQIEAARSLGLRDGARLRTIMLPQAIPLVLPAIGGQFVQLVKDTSLLYVIAVMELTKAGDQVGNETYQFLEAYLVSCILYIVVCATLNVALDVFEQTSGLTRFRRA